MKHAGSTNICLRGTLVCMSLHTFGFWLPAITESGINDSKTLQKMCDLSVLLHILAGKLWPTMEHEPLHQQVSQDDPYRLPNRDPHNPSVVTSYL